MSDVTSIELLLDPETEARVRADWQRLAAAGLSSLAAHRAASNRPHLTLLVRPQLEPADFGAAIAQLPIALVLQEPVVFPHSDGRGVLAWKVTPCDRLLQLHRTVHETVAAGEDAAHTAPGEWTPHITLARRLRLEALPEALELVGPAHVGSGIALRRWDAASATVTALS
jgi:2'-5' RNA ligase